MFSKVFAHKGNAVIHAYWERPLDYLQIDVGVRVNPSQDWMGRQLFGIPFESVVLNQLARDQEGKSFMHGYEDEQGPARDRIEQACRFLRGNGSWILDPDAERLREAVHA